jgi:hypothetical protein
MGVGFRAMSKQMSITIPDEIYEGLLGASGESMRPIATEAVYRIRLGLGGQGKSAGLGTIPSPKKEEIKTDIIEGPQVTTSGNNYTGPRTMGGNVKDLVKRGLVKRGVKELPSQDEGGFKTYFK